MTPDQTTLFTNLGETLDRYLSDDLPIDAEILGYLKQAQSVLKENLHSDDHRVRDGIWNFCKLFLVQYMGKDLNGPLSKFYQELHQFHTQYMELFAKEYY